MPKEEEMKIHYDPKIILGEKETASSIEKISAVLRSLETLLIEKNKRYGNSALEPLGVFTSFIPGDDIASYSILARLDDKLQRIKNSTELRKNDVADLLGYIVLLSVNKGWTDFSELID